MKFTLTQNGTPTCASGLTDEPRPGAPRKASDERLVDVITRTLEGLPDHATQWTTFF